VAVTWYRRAASLTNTEEALGTFFLAMEEGRKKSGALAEAATAIADARTDLFEVIRSWLPDGPTSYDLPEEISESLKAEGKPGYVHEPNLPRAICLTNSAAAKLQQHAQLAVKQTPARSRRGSSRRIRSLLKSALSDAEDAVRFCPEYVKARYRVAQAKRLLGDEGGADRIERQMRLWHERSPLCWVGFELICFGWLTYVEYDFLYSPAYFEHACRQVLSEHKAGSFDAPHLVTSAALSASLVPLTGGQWLLVGLQYFSSSLGPTKIDAIEFRALDTENGDDVERPPNGRASKLSLARFPVALRMLLRKLKDRGVGVHALCLGQALTEQVERIRECLKKEYRNVDVYPALTTYATQIEAFGREEADRIANKERNPFFDFN